MSWTHHLCSDCYQGFEPGRQPVRVVEDSMGTCCKCGRLTQEGICYRKDPKLMPCKGTGPSHDA